MLKDTDIRFYEINNAYIEYLSPFATHLFFNKKSGQSNERKYIGIVLYVNGFKYFAPLSSAKEKHKHMKDSLDFIKVKSYAVINLNNMFPVPETERHYIDINKVENPNYRNLLRNEYRVIKVISKKILKNAQIVYSHKVHNGNKTNLCKRCNDFLLLEEKAKEFISI